MPEAPETLEGRYCLHDFRRLDWPKLRSLAPEDRASMAREAGEFLAAAEAQHDAEEGSSACFNILGHKADLMILHLRQTVDELAALEQSFAQTRLAEYAMPVYSYVSITELGLYEASARGAGTNPMDSPFVQARLKPPVPAARYVVFYPMNKRRGEQENWYMLPMEERRGMMRSHGTIGHRYHGRVQQMITGSVGLDDWEWGVTLFAEDPLLFKKLVYDMRFDEVSARFAEFGPFLFGIRLPADDLPGYLSGQGAGGAEER